MNIPLPPPSEAIVLSSIEPNRLLKVFVNSNPLVDGKYLHWDELKHRTPPSDLTLEEWWVTIRMARIGQSNPLHLLNKNGAPFVLTTPEPVLIDLHHIDRDAAGEIRASAEINTSTYRDRYVLHSLIEEAITSSQLEGAATTRKVAESMLREKRKPRDRSERMIFNNYAAMEMIRELREQSITPERILDLHRILTEETLDDPKDVGSLRRSDDVHVADNHDGTILHQPPPFAELPERLARLCEFANAKEGSSPFVHPVLRAILLHFMIGYDHPFADGNGRTARALFYWSMARSGYWLMEYLSISHFLKRAPSQYVRAYLYTETDSNDTTYFVLHQLNVIRKSLAALHEYLGRTANAQKSTLRLLSASPSLRNKLNHRQITLITHALKHEGEAYRIDIHQHTHKVVYQTARMDLLGLAELGLLHMDKSKRPLLFIAPSDLHERIGKMMA